MRKNFIKFFTNLIFWMQFDHLGDSSESGKDATKKCAKKLSLNGGFIALITSIIISVILVGLVFTTSSSGFFSRINALNSEFKRTSLDMAESCSDLALLKIANNYNYAPPPGGETIPIGSGNCLIRTVTYGAEDPVTHRKTVALNTGAEFKGAWTNLNVSASAGNPAIAPVEPLPTCSLIAVPDSVPSGLNTTLLWGSSANAISIVADHLVGALTPTLSGSKSITPSGIGNITYSAVVTNASGGTNTCSATINVTLPPPAPTCADTVMILDRTGSMAPELTNERNAAIALKNLYASVSPAPQLGVGSFGGLEYGSPLVRPSASIPQNPPTTVSGLLSTNYTNITDAITALMAGTSSGVGSNLSAAISVGADELNSVRHTIGKQKVLLLVSDGIANRPTVESKSTDFMSPTDQVQNASGDAWTAPTSAFADGGTDAQASVGAVGAGLRHRFYKFNFPISWPAGTIITGIDAVADAWTERGLASNSINLNSTSLGNYDFWKSNSGTKTSAILSNDNDTTFIQNADAQTWKFAGAGVTPGSKINSVTLTVVAKEVGGDATIKLMAENGAVSNPSFGANVDLTGSYATYTQTWNTNPFTGSNWTDTEVNAWTTNFGIIRTNPTSATVQVTQASVTVNFNQVNPPTYYSPIANSADTGNGFETNPTGAYTDSGTQASNVNGNNQSHRYYNYNIPAIPAGSIITKIEVRSDWYTDSNSGTNSVAVDLSWLAGVGANWTTPITEGTESTSDTNSKTLDGGANTWGRTWAPGDFTNANFRVRIKTTYTSGSRTFYLDWIPVRITYVNGTPSNATLAPTGIGNFDDFQTNTGTKWSAVNANDGDTSFVSPTSNTQTFAFTTGTAVPPGASITSVVLTAVGKDQNGNSSISLLAEKGAGVANQNIGAVQNLTTNYANYTQSWPINPFTGVGWTPAEINAGAVKFGVIRNSGGTAPARITNMFLTVNYTSAPVGVSCQLGVDLSWNNGATSPNSWSSEQKLTLSGTETPYTFNVWGPHTWATSELTNSKFIARVHSVNTGANCQSADVDHLDWLRLKVNYTIPADPFAAATLSANAAKAGGGSDGTPITIYGIHFGTDLPGTNFLSSLITQNSVVANIALNGAVRVGTVATITTSSNHGFLPGQAVLIAGVLNSVFNGYYTITSTPTATTFTYSYLTSANITSTGGTATVLKNFFLSPNSTDMQGIFQKIGLAVCPAAAPDCSNTIDDDSDGLVDIADPSCHSDGDANNYGSYDPLDNDEWSIPVLPPPPSPPPSPPNITINSWQEI